MQAPVLVLNANFEPLNVCNTRRALTLMLVGKASLVLNGRGYFRSVTQLHPIPSIIRLEHQVKRPHPSVKLTKKEIFRRDRFTCQYCGALPGRLTVDHIIPRHLGGEHSWQNLVTACPTCNHSKGGRTLEQANMQLLHSPSEPSASARYLFDRYISSNSEWIPYIDGW